MTSRFKPNFQKNIISSLQLIADYDAQKYSITDPHPILYWIYSEHFETIFEDNTLVEGWQEGEWMFSEEIDQAIADLAPELKKIDGRLMEDVIIDLPQMQVLREKAAVILHMLGQPTRFPIDECNQPANPATTVF